MIDTKELRKAINRHGASIVCDDELIELLDRLEATEEDRSNFIVEMGRLCAQCDALRAKIEQMERQEPVAWYSKQYGFVYMSRQPSQFEHGSILYLRNGVPAWRIEGGSRVALLDMASLPHGTVFYALPGAKGDEK